MLCRRGRGSDRHRVAYMCDCHYFLVNDHHYNYYCTYSVVHKTAHTHTHTHTNTERNAILFQIASAFLNLVHLSTAFVSAGTSVARGCGQQTRKKKRKKKHSSRCRYAWPTDTPGLQHDIPQLRQAIALNSITN
jgi:hypothetical protein